MNAQAKNKHWILLLIGITAACSLFQPDPETVRRHPWATQSVRDETREYFCQQLNFPPDHPVCQPGKQVLTLDLLRALQQEFPPRETPYSEVAERLKGYPVEVEESKLPDGTVTGRIYVYLLTEFDGFCVYFVMSDENAEMVERVGSSNPSGSETTADLCGSAKLRRQPRPWLK